MEIRTIKELVSNAFSAGFNAAQIECGLRSDKLRRKEARRFLAMRGVCEVTLDKWIASGLIEEHKGDSINSPRWYSLNEINKVLTSLQIKELDY